MRVCVRSDELSDNSEGVASMARAELHEKRIWRYELDALASHRCLRKMLGVESNEVVAVSGERCSENMAISRVNPLELLRKFRSSAPTSSATTTELQWGLKNFAAANSRSASRI